MAAEHARESSDTYPLFRYPDPARDRRISFDLEPIDPPVIFLPLRTVGIHIRGQNQALLGDALTVQRGPEGEVRYLSSDTRGLRYDAYLAGEHEIVGEVLPAFERWRYLTTPSKLPPRIAALANQWAEGQPSDLLKARALEDHLRHDFRYDVNSPSGGKPIPLDDFLFESRRGHCEFFSTAMAIMLRDLGIPSRNVTGFVGGTYNRFGHYYAVREGDAHSWVEAYMDDPAHPGWMTFDPTPSSGAQPLENTTGVFVYARDIVEALSQRWNRYVVGYDLRAQIRLFDDVGRRYEAMRSRTGVNKGLWDRLTRAPALAVGALLGFVVAYAVWRRRRNPKASKDSNKVPGVDPRIEGAAALYRTLDAALTAQGLARPPSLPPLRHAVALADRKHPLAGETIALTEIYLETRFGHALLTEATKRDFERRVREIRAFRPQVTSP
jgi:transglutaminase-like putative cysteine protease